MQLNYQLTKSDFLEYQLYTSSKSKLHKKKRFRNRILVPIIYIVFALYSLINNKNYVTTITFIAISIIWFALYPKYSSCYYKKFLKKHVDENYKNRVNKPIELSFNDDFINIKDFTSESKINGSEIKELIETKDHFFLKLKTDLSLIVPKYGINNCSEFINTVTSLGAEHINELQWRFK